MRKGEKRVAVTLEQLFLRGAFGYATNSTFDDTFWKRYLSVFEEVVVIARVKEWRGPLPDHYQVIDGNYISFVEITPYRGPVELLSHLPRVLQQLADASSIRAAHIIRLPGVLGSILALLLCAKQVPFALEVVGDPQDVFQPGGAGEGPFRPLYKALLTSATKFACRRAAGVAYVTEETLQRAYPSSRVAFTTSYSSIELPAEWLADARTYPKAKAPLSLISVGSLEQPTKGMDVLIDAVNLLVQSGRDVQAIIVGEGALRASLEGQAARYRIEDRIIFSGHLPRTEIRQLLDGADLFVLATRGEGLPRVLIEAMARGLPCVSTAVSGIPEILPAKYLVPPNNALALAEKVEELMESAEALREGSVHGVSVASRFESRRLQQRRQEFYRQVSVIASVRRGAGRPSS